MTCSHFSKLELKKHPSHLLPGLWYSRVVHLVECIAEIVAHNDRSIDREFKIVQHRAHERDDALHPVNFLPQENVHWLNRAHFLKSSFDLKQNEVAMKSACYY